MDEEKQVNNTDQQPGETAEVKQAMTSDAQAEMNNTGSEATDQVSAETNQVGDGTSQNENAPVAGGTTEVDAAALADVARQIDTLKAQLEERNNQYVRIAADFENFRKRNQKEKEELEQQVKRNTITELLPVVDNFDRARAQIKPQTDAEQAIHKSYQSVYKQLVESLKRLGVSPMRSEGQQFDPNLHEAVMREATDEYPEGTVLEELVRGYYLGERVLRHAMVKVAAPKEDVIPSEENQSSTANS